MRVITSPCLNVCLEEHLMKSSSEITSKLWASLNMVEKCSIIHLCKAHSFSNGCERIWNESVLCRRGLGTVCKRAIFPIWPQGLWAILGHFYDTHICMLLGCVPVAFLPFSESIRGRKLKSKLNMLFFSIDTQHSFLNSNELKHNIYIVNWFRRWRIYPPSVLASARRQLLGTWWGCAVIENWSRACQQNAANFFDFESGASSDFLIKVHPSKLNILRIILRSNFICSVVLHLGEFSSYLSHVLSLKAMTNDAEFGHLYLQSSGHPRW